MHNSVKNMTVDATFHDLRCRAAWKKILSNLLTKKNYFNLIYINILLDIQQRDLVVLKSSLHWIFGILRENKTVLKYQFTRLRIGLKSRGF